MGRNIIFVLFELGIGYMKTNIGIEQRVREYPPQLGQ
jgi:hypothetical protein